MIHASSAATGKTTPPKRAAINPEGLTCSEPNGPNPVTKTRPDETVEIMMSSNEKSQGETALAKPSKPNVAERRIRSGRG
jgi:hypothetical protein